MNPEDEPGLKRTADAASGAAQRIFLRLNLAQLALLGATGIISGWAPPSTLLQRTIAVTVCVLMMGALAVGTALKIGTFDDKWFKCRALAENVKSSTWYYIMVGDESRESGESDYLKQVAEVQDRLSGIHKELALHRVDGPLITDWMRKTQSLDVSARMALYRNDRLKNQIDWYQAKAVINGRQEATWQWVVFSLEFCGVVYAALNAWNLWEFNALGGIAGISAGLVAWTQTKRHSDLANTYAVAADDLRRIEAANAHVVTEEQITQFVRDVETAVSREHSMWLARRLS